MWTIPIMPLKARQHQGPVQMSGCCDTSQKEAVSQWKPGGQCKNRQGDKRKVLMQKQVKPWITRTCCITIKIIT